MADQKQRELEDFSSNNEPNVPGNSGNETNCLNVHNNGRDNESSADGNEGVNDRIDGTTSEESGNEDNGKTINDENGGINETFGKEGSDKVATCIDTRVDEIKKDNETRSLDADGISEKGGTVFEKGICDASDRGDGQKNSETNDEVAQKGKDRANDKGNNETSDTGYAEKTKTGIDETSYETERDENKTGNDKENMLISEPTDERNEEVTQKGKDRANGKGNNETSNKSYTERIKTGTDKTIYEGESDENKTGNHKRFILNSEAADERNDGASLNGEGKTTNAGKIVITEYVNADQPDANLDKKNDTTFEENSRSNEEGNDSDKPDGKMVSKGAECGPVIKATNDEIILEGPVNNEDANRRKDETRTCSNERDNTPIQDENKQSKKRPQELINQTPEKNDRTTEKGDNTVEEMTCEPIYRGNDTKSSETNEAVTQKGKDSENDKVKNETSDTGYAGKTNTGTDETQKGDSGENKTGNEETNILVGKTTNEKHDEASYNGEGETNIDRKDVTERINADQSDANAKERSEEDSSSNEEGNDSKIPDEKMITEMDRQETVNKATTDEIIHESNVYNEDTNIQKDATMTCSNESDNTSIQDENKQLKKELQELINQTLEEKNKNAITLNEMTALLRKRDVDFKEYRLVIQQNNHDISQLKAQIQNLQEENSVLLLRLSKVASTKLTQNNPNIADLSDANRPTKLADQFSELYDNEYTDAIDELNEQQCIEEQAAIDNMLTLLQAVNDECEVLMRKQEDGMKCLTTFSFKIDQCPILRERSILTNPSDNEHTTLKTTADQETEEVTIEIQLPVDRKSLFDIRTLCATKVEEECSMSEIIASKIALQRGITPESSHKMLAYITKCAKLCWYMAMKEPPVFVGFHTVVDGELFNKDTYRAYTKAGALLDFVVWPPLYLYKSGPLLCKGVAQGK